MSQIDNEISRLRERALADAKKYEQEKLIELNKKKMIPEKIFFQMTENIKNSEKKIYSISLKEYLDEGRKLLKEFLHK